jgi:hypothetical protein
MNRLLALLTSLLLAWTGSAADRLDCTLELNQEADVFVITYFEHENPNEKGKRFRLQSPVGHSLGGTITLASEWNPVAVEWRSRPAGSDEPFTTAKTCGEIPDPVYVAPDPEALPELDCPIDLSGTVEIYLVAYYLHEDESAPGLRYRYTSAPIVASENQNPTITAEGFPVAFEVFTRTSPTGEFSLWQTCGTVPDPVFPPIFQSGFETGNLAEWSESSL